MYGQGRNDQGNYLNLCPTQKLLCKFGRPVFQSWGSTISIPLFHQSALVQVLYQYYQYDQSQYFKSTTSTISPCTWYCITGSTTSMISLGTVLVQCTTSMTSLSFILVHVLPVLELYLYYHDDQSQYMYSVSTTSIMVGTLVLSV